MKKIIVGILIGFILFAAVWFIDSIIYSRELIPAKTVFITIKNEADFKLNKAALKHGDGELFISNMISIEKHTWALITLLKIHILLQLCLKMILFYNLRDYILNTD